MFPLFDADYKKGWWKISEEKVKEVVASLEPRGVREREFLASITRLRTDHMWESTLKVGSGYNILLRIS